MNGEEEDAPPVGGGGGNAHWLLRVFQRVAENLDEDMREQEIHREEERVSFSVLWSVVCLLAPNSPSPCCTGSCS